MDRRHSFELALPGATIGAVAGAMAGGLTLFAGAPTGLAALAALALAAPLALFGGLYGVLVGHGVLRPGTFGPAGLYWMAAFPLSRLLQESVVGLGMADGVLAFLAYQAMVSLGFAIGFVWLHERVMPYWLARRADVNPRAAELLGVYVRYATLLRARKKGSRR
ncbi:hypothetical protein MF672_040360 [Actinomadura sp. ATCC 31491]|uniref:Uncharacterized protein n=1 Tax=Actinomadura luzonensis TaxID=2805427 RepID=A0ABT0G5W8_9ACTN|nr:hypothetical protein [Actinomadura luzonensis]MCK2220007.1 hypothetical protein [Actinomadura luzonensis]